MTSMRGRGRGARGGPVGDSYRRGSWRGGPPGSAGYNRTPARAEAKPEEKAKGFQTDTDISAATRTSERELKPWNPDEHANSGATANGGTTSTAGSASALRDALTFGAGMSSTPWDQFDTNERLFGVKTTYEEEIYTTKLDRSAPDYKKRERDADRQATEILTKPSNNPHVAEERNHSTPPGGDGKDEEEKYSGVVRNPNAYVPPGARKTGGAPSRKDTPAKDTKEAAPAPAPRAAAPPATVTTPVPMPPVVAPAPKSNGPSVSSIGPPLAKESDKKPARAPSPIPGPGPRSSADPAVDPAIASLGPPPAPTMTRSTSSVPPAQANGDGTAPTALPPIGAAVNQAREFVESERQRVVARKQSLVKNERAHVFADLKAWQTKFSVPLPLPKDILPILAKDEGKQKEIEAKADKALHEIKSKSPQKTPTPLTPEAARPLPKKIPMKIPEIPPFRKKVPPAVPVPETAAQNITLVTSPTPSNTSITSGATHAKLNPNASAFVFKPNPSAAAFKPAGAATGSGAGGGPGAGASLAAPAPPTAIESSVNSPASRTGPLPGPSTAVSPVRSSAAMVSSPIPAHASVPAAPKNPFYRDGPPKRISVNPREDFNPFKHGGQVPSASTVAPQWPYTGRRSSVAFSGGGAPMPHPMMNASSGGGFDDDQQSASSPHPSHQPAPPHMVPPPNLMQFYRYQPGPPNMQPGMMPMFGHGHQFMPPNMGQSPSHMQPPQPGPNGMPMYFPNNIPPNAHFIPPQMHFHPNGPGRPGPGGPMFYPGQMSPHQAPQMQPQMSFQGQPTPPQPHFQQPLPAQGPPPPFEGSPAP